jgi:ubiquinone/menaquinone biosynthesis C-methylase UbiE
MKLAKVTSVYRSKLIYKAFKNWFNKDQIVLDIGCGTGIVLLELNKLSKFKKIIGCDIDNYLFVNVPFKKMESINKLPFKNKEYDIAMFNDVLHHTTFKNQEKLLKEAIRVAKTILIFELKPTVIGKICDYVLNKIHNPNMNVPYTFRTRTGWEKLFTDQGIKYKAKNVKSPRWYPFTHVAFKLTK